MISRTCCAIGLKRDATLVDPSKKPSRRSHSALCPHDRKGLNVTSPLPTPPAVRENDRHLIAPWFRITGHNELSPEWAITWAALVAAGLAGEHGLTLWPTAHEESLPEDTLAAQLVTLALNAGARYSLATTPPQHAEGVPQAEDHLNIDAGTAVAVVLALLRKIPSILREALSSGKEQRVELVLAELRARVIGVFPNAPAALDAQIATTKATAVHALGATALTEGPWPPLIELVLQGAVKDEIVAEYVLLQADEAMATGLGCVVLPDNQWLVFRMSPDCPE